jgi:hypothetical protein
VFPEAMGGGALTNAALVNRLKSQGVFSNPAVEKGKHPFDHFDTLILLLLLTVLGKQPC